jgi:hypothetical protein
MAVASINAGGDFRVGDVLSRAWQIFTGNLLFFLGVPFVIQVVIFVAALVFGLTIMVAGFATGATWLLVVGGFVAVAVVLSLHMIGQGVLLFGAFQRLRGQPPRVGEALNKVLSRFWPLVGLGILWVVALFVVGFVSMFVVSALATALGPWFLVLSPAFFVPTAMLWVMWAVVVPACIVESMGAVASMSRSADLTKGYRWKVFGIMLLLGLVFLLVLFVQAMIGLVSQALSSIVSMILSVGWIAYLDCVIIMTYHDLRVAKEGIDTEQIASIFD